jgi:hypothetical protein
LPLIFLPPTLTLDLGDLPNLCDFAPERDLNPCDLHDATHDAGSSELGRDDRHTLAGAAPMASAGVKNNSMTYILLFNFDKD